MTCLPYHDVSTGLQVSEPVAEKPQLDSPAEEVEVQPEPEQYIRELVHARAFYRTWISWTFPRSPATTNAWVERKCPMDSCGQRFKDLPSIFLHLEGDCEGLKSCVKSEYARAQQAAAVSGPPHPCGGRCPWCWARSLFDNGKSISLKRLSMKSMKKLSLKRYRKGADPAKDALPPQLSTWSTTSLSPSSSQPPTYEPEHEAMDVIAHEIGGNPLDHPVELYAIERPSELDDTGLTAYEIISGFRDRATEPLRGVSMMSEFTSSSRGRDSLISPCSQPSIPTPSTTLSPLSITTPLESSGPIFADSYTSSPVDSGHDDFPPSLLSAIELPASVPPALHSKEISFGLPLPSLLSPITTVPQSLEAVGAEPHNIPDTPVPSATPSSPPTRSSNEMLERLKDAFSKLRRTSFGESNGRDLVNTRSISTLSDDVYLRGALDELEKQLQGQRDKGTIFTCCFAYLAMAMATEIREYLSPIFYPALCQDMAEFVKTEPEEDVRLSWRFLSVSKDYIDVLRSFMSNSPLDPDYEKHESTGDRDDRHLESFQEMNSYLRANPWPRRPSALPSSRQYSCDSTASTLVEEEPRHPPYNLVPQQHQPLANFTNPSHTPINTFCFNAIPNGLPKVPIRRQHAPLKTRIPLPQRRQRPLSTSCEPCCYFPSPGPDQQKKLVRHRRTDNHIDRVTGVSRDREIEEDVQEELDVGMDEGKAKQVRFPCTLPLIDGSACTKTFNRKDNLRQHCKRKHPEEGDDGEGDGGVRVKRRRVIEVLDRQVDWR